jgi:hypothetical protein
MGLAYRVDVWIVRMASARSVCNGRFLLQSVEAVVRTLTKRELAFVAGGLYDTGGSGGAGGAGGAGGRVFNSAQPGLGLGVNAPGGLANAFVFITNSGLGSSTNSDPGAAGKAGAAGA